MKVSKAVSKYMGRIGKKGGKKSRRSLDPETARKMAKKSAAVRRKKKPAPPEADNGQS